MDMMMMMMCMAIKIIKFQCLKQMLLLLAIHVSVQLMLLGVPKAIFFIHFYRNVPKFSDRQVWANSADPDQTAPSLIRVYTVCNSLCIFWMHYPKETPSCSTFRVITINFRMSEILGFLR